jgi:hypothetical protein
VTELEGLLDEALNEWVAPEVTIDGCFTDRGKEMFDAAFAFCTSSEGIEFLRQVADKAAHEAIGVTDCSDGTTCLNDNFRDWWHKFSTKGVWIR